MFGGVRIGRDERALRNFTAAGRTRAASALVSGRRDIRSIPHDTRRKFAAAGRGDIPAAASTTTAVSSAIAYSSATTAISSTTAGAGDNYYYKFK